MPSRSSKADYEACQARDEAAFRTAIQGISIRALQTGIANVDYRAAVGDQWRRIGMDQIIDDRVDLAVEEVRKETSWGNLLQSLANQQKAQELATAVAERVYRSDAIKAALEQLAVGVGNEVGKQMEFASQDVAEPALACLKAFVGARYGETAARAVIGGDAGKGIAIDPNKGAAEMSSERRAARIRAAASPAPRCCSCAVSSPTWRRGSASASSAAFWRASSRSSPAASASCSSPRTSGTLRNGVLPIIATEMKSKENKDKVQEELAKTFAEQISGHIQEIGAATADRVIDIWRDFRSAHAEALGLAERNPKFKAFVDSLQPAALPRLDEVVALLLAGEGEAGILRRLDDGTLSTAINKLPAPAMDIARETRSIDAGIKWAALAGDTCRRWWSSASIAARSPIS